LGCGIDLPHRDISFEEHAMTRRIAPAVGLLVTVGFSLVCPAPAHAVITRLTPLAEILSGQQYIFTATVEKADPAIPGIVLSVNDQLKGKVPFERMPVNMTGDSEAKKEKHPEQLFKRVKPKLPVMVFAGGRGKNFTAFVFSDGTWFQILGVKSDGDKVTWSLAHGEPYLRRTFKGTTAELKQIVIDGLANKKDPPKPNEKEEPGFGPEVKPDAEKNKEEGRGSRIEDRGARTEASRGPTDRLAAIPQGCADCVGKGIDVSTGRQRGPLFAVIPTVFIMGPLALLAALFPAVFGGLALFMKRWMALLMVACTNSTLFTLQMLLGGYARGAWWGSTTALWAAMTLVTLIGAVWSARRYRTVLSENHSEDPTPRRIERIILTWLSVIGVVVVILSGLSFGPVEWQLSSALSSPWKDLLVFWVGAWGGGLYLLYLRAVPKRNQAVPVELVVLWAMLFAYANLTTLEMAQAAGGGGSAISLGSAVSTGDATKGAKLSQVSWTRVFEGGGTIVSTPLIDGDRVYVGVSHAAGLDVFGIFYCLERDTGKIVWQFDAQQELKQIFSSPCIADGKLYFGEGLHTERQSKVYCVDAATGKEVWRYQTQSHTESSPCVGDGKVFFGAGDDGVLCCNAATGDKLWQFQPGLHVDASPTVVGKRLYAGSGISRTHKTTAMFCLDIDTGKPVWSVNAELPVWSSPTIVGEHAFYGLGNGQYGMSAEKPAGAVMCVEVATGKRIWERPVPDGVLDKPLVDERHVYVGSRDAQFYCLDRADGRVVWKRDMGSPVVSGAKLARCGCCGGVSAIYAAASDGRLCCLDPDTGNPFWTFELARHTGLKPQLYATPAVITLSGEGERRQIILAAGLTDAKSVSSARVFSLEDRGKP
jgi:outer membrane protein assembly factor BamB